MIVSRGLEGQEKVEMVHNKRKGKAVMGVSDTWEKEEGEQEAKKKEKERK